MTVPDLKVKLFADGADVAGMVEMYRRPWIKGFTTNPTLMRKAGVSDYRAFAREVLAAIPDRPISFEVFSDDFDEMARQAHEIASWGANVNVKIPVTNTRGAPSYELIRELSAARIMLNVTAVFTLDSTQAAVAQESKLVHVHRGAELIWASPREVLNVFHADAVGCDIITVTNDLLAKLPACGKDLAEFSLETVQMFRNDAVKAGYRL